MHACKSLKKFINKGKEKGFFFFFFEKGDFYQELTE